MDQMSFGDGEYASKRKRTRRETFLAEMEQVIPWTILLNLIEPVYPKAGNGRPPYPLKVMLKGLILPLLLGHPDKRFNIAIRSETDEQEEIRRQDGTQALQRGVQASSAVACSERRGSGCRARSDPAPASRTPG